MNVKGHVMFATKKISPGGHWMNITRVASNQVKATVAQATEAYVLVSLSLADGFISCWDEKYRSKLIRPETYINQSIDENWVPLLQTPPFPEYPSGHSVISGAAAVALTKLLGDNFAFTDSTEVEFGMPPRSFKSFIQASEEAAVSRMYGGIHYTRACEVGKVEGRAVGRVWSFRDISQRWGVQIKYERPLPEPGWRIGWLATANRTSQPNTPNTDALNIPQDPGHANAYELGVGVSRRSGPALFGMDVVYQPIWSTTWAEASTPTATSGGGLIPVGGRTIENGFHFSNALFRMGFSHEVGRSPTKTTALQLGLVVRSVHYNLAQRDFVEVTTRRLAESWLEWTPTWGLSVRFPEAELRYRGRVTHGTDRLVPPSDVVFGVADARPIGFFPPPALSPTLDGVHVVTHQFSISLPLR